MLKNLPLLSILVIATILRFWGLGTNPIHLTPDEAALGYNAYSILKTGRDEYGQRFPIVFKSFGDYKPGLYIYSDIPFIAIFGLNEFSTRLPGAIAGLVAVLMIYFIANALFSENNVKTSFLKLNVGHVASFLLALSPWHIHLSRGAWESNLALTLTLAGIHFFLKSLDRPKFYYYSALLFGFTFWAYQGAKLSTPLTILSLLLAYRIKLPQTKVLIKPTIVLSLLALPIIISLRTGSGRLKVYSLFAYRRSPEEISQLLSEDGKSQKTLSYYLYHSEPLYLSKVFLLHYFNYFSPRFLLFEGDWTTLRHSTPYHGVMYIFEAVFLVIGVVKIVNSSSSGQKFMLYWLATAPLSAALSRDIIHGVRSLNFVAPLTLATAFGLIYLVRSFKSAKPIIALIIILYTISLVRFLDLEFIHTSLLNAKYWYFGYKQVVNALSPIQTQYQKIIFNQSYAQPYIYFLFYQKYDPRKWWPQVRLKENPNGDVGLIEKIDNVEFRPLAWSGDKYLSNTLVVGEPLAMDPNAKNQTDVRLVKEIEYPDKSPAFYIFASKKQ